MPSDRPRFRATGLDDAGLLWDLYRDDRRIEVEIDLEDVPLAAKRAGGIRNDTIDMQAHDGYRSKLRIP